MTTYSPSLLDERRERHRPKTAEEILDAAIRLRADGHSDATIAQVLRLDVLAVIGMLGAPDRVRS